MTERRRYIDVLVEAAVGLPIDSEPPTFPRQAENPRPDGSAVGCEFQVASNPGQAAEIPVRIATVEQNRATDWTHEVSQLSAWFVEAYTQSQLPTEPFQVAPHMTITGSARWYTTLREDIRSGPLGPRGKVLPEDLRMLKAHINHAVTTK